MVQSGFYAWAIVALAMIFYLLSCTVQGKKLVATYAILTAVWIAYVSVISYSGILTDFSTNSFKTSQCFPLCFSKAILSAINSALNSL